MFKITKNNDSVIVEKNGKRLEVELFTEEVIFAKAEKADWDDIEYDTFPEKLVLVVDVEKDDVSIRVNLNKFDPGFHLQTLVRVSTDCQFCRNKAAEMMQRLKSSLADTSIEVSLFPDEENDSVSCFELVETMPGDQAVGSFADNHISVIASVFNEVYGSEN